jgi:hypothetical protein
MTRERLEQYANASFPISETDSGITISTNPLQPMNVPVPMLVADFGISISTRPNQ